MLNNLFIERKQLSNLEYETPCINKKEPNKSVLEPNR